MPKEDKRKISPLKIIALISYTLFGVATSLWYVWSFQMIFGYFRFFSVCLFLLLISVATTYASKPRKIKGENIIYNPTELPLLLGWVLGICALLYLYGQVDDTVDLTTVQYVFGIIHLIGWTILLVALVVLIIKNKDNQITLSPLGIEILTNEKPAQTIQWTEIQSIQYNNSLFTFIMTDDTTLPIHTEDFNMIDDHTLLEDLKAFVGEIHVVKKSDI